MAKKQISDVLVKFKGDHKGLDNSIGGSTSSLKRFGTSAMSAVGALVKLGAVGAVAMAGLTFAAWKMTAAAKDYGVAIDKAMKVTGLGAQTITEMAYAAEQEHASIEDLEKGWKRLSKAMVDADDGLAESKRAFEGIGVSIYDVSGKLKTVDVMTYELADAFSAMSDDTKKAGLAQDIFGRAGMNLIPFLEMGSKGIQELGAQSKALGNVWTDEMAAASKKFDDKLTEINYSLRATKWAIGNELMPEFEKIVDWLITNGDWMKTTFTEIFDIDVGDFGTLVVEQLDNIKAWVDTNKGTLVDIWDGFKTGIDMTITSLKVLLASIMTVSAASKYIMAVGGKDEKARWSELQAVSASTAGMYQDIGQKDWAQDIVGGLKAPTGGGGISGREAAIMATGPLGAMTAAAGTFTGRAMQQKIEIVLDSGAVEKFLTGQVVGVTNIATISGT